MELRHALEGERDGPVISDRRPEIDAAGHDRILANHLAVLIDGKRRQLEPTVGEHLRRRFLPRRRGNRVRAEVRRQLYQRLRTDTTLEAPTTAAVRNRARPE